VRREQRKKRKMTKTFVLAEFGFLAKLGFISPSASSASSAPSANPLPILPINGD
jgi:hypothetical protein